MARIKELFGIDARSLALFRIGCGSIILWDLWLRSSDLTAFYSDQGILPRSALLSQLGKPWTLSLHLMSGNANVQAVLFIIQALCAIALIVGFHTRLMVFFSWVLLTSLHERNSIILMGGDDYLRFLLFWSLFIPMETQFSIDGMLRQNSKIGSPQIFNGGTAALLLQNAVIYWVTAAHKWKYPVWHDGTAVYYTLHIDLFAKPAAQWLLLFPSVVHLLTPTVLWFETLGPFLLFCPFWTQKVRTFTAFAFIGMHLGFWCFMNLSPFPQVSALAMIPFLPAWFWECGSRILRRGPPFPSARRFRNTLKNTVRRLADIPLLKERSFHLNKPASRSQSIREYICNGLVVILFAFIVLWNIRAVLNNRTVRIPQIAEEVCYFLHIDQSWQMFATPTRESGWYVFMGRLRGGIDVDLGRDGAPLSWAKPQTLPHFRSERWRGVARNLGLGWYRDVWPNYGDYLCRSWNASHSDSTSIESVSIVFITKTTPPEGQTDVYSKKVLMNYNCPS